MAQVTCYYCKKKINKNIAVEVKDGRRAKNYCPEHVGMKPIKDQMYDMVYEIFGRKVLNTILYKEMDEIAKVYSYEKMLAYMKDHRADFENAMLKPFQNEFCEIRYFTALFKNGLHDYKAKEPELEIKKEVEIDLNISADKYKAKKKKTGMDSLLEGLLNDKE